MTHTITEARYAKGKLIVHSSDDSGYKTPEAHLIEALGGRWVNRSNGYVASPRTVADFELLLAAGWFARASWYQGVTPTFSHPDHEGVFSRKGALVMAKEPAA